MGRLVCTLGMDTWFKSGGVKRAGVLSLDWGRERGLLSFKMTLSEKRERETHIQWKMNSRNFKGMFGEEG